MSNLSVKEVLYETAKAKQTYGGSRFGKFEGESDATYYFYAVMMDGDGELVYTNEDLGESATCFELSEEEKQAFHTTCKYAVLETTSQGFVILNFSDTKE